MLFCPGRYGKDETLVESKGPFRELRELINGLPYDCDGHLVGLMNRAFFPHTSMSRVENEP